MVFVNYNYLVELVTADLYVKEIGFKLACRRFAETPEHISNVELRVSRPV